MARQMRPPQNSPSPLGGLSGPNATITTHNRQQHNAINTATTTTKLQTQTKRLLQQKRQQGQRHPYNTPGTPRLGSCSGPCVGHCSCPTSAPSRSPTFSRSVRHAARGAATLNLAAARQPTTAAGGRKAAAVGTDGGRISAGGARRAGRPAFPGARRDGRGRSLSRRSAAVCVVSRACC